MPLARIITRSQTCSRELALALLARGYAVEIVSPDNISDSFADLELRVDAGAADELVANVEAHNGEHTSSLEFVHHLKAPVLDFARPPSEPGEMPHPSGESVSSKAETDIEDTVLPVEDSQPPPMAVPLAVETLRHREADAEIDSGEEGCLVAPQVVPPSKDHLGSFAVEGTAALQPGLIQRTLIQPILIQPTSIRQRSIQQTLTEQTIVPQQIVPPPQAKQRRNRSARWPWRAGLAFISLVLLAVALGLGMRRSGKAATASSDGLPAAGIVLSTGVNLSSAAAAKDAVRDPGQISSVPWAATAAGSEANSSPGLKQAQVAKSGTTATSPGSAVSSRHGDDLIARDTTIYFDKRFEPAPKAKRAKPISRQRAPGKNSENTN